MSRVADAIGLTFAADENGVVVDVGFGMAELLLFGVIGLFSLIGLGLVVWAVIDMAGHSEAEFAAIGSNRTTWLVSTIVLTFVCGIGWIAAVVYLLSVRPKLRGR